MRIVYNIGFINNSKLFDKTQLTAENINRLMELIDSLKEELDIKEIRYIVGVGKTMYRVRGIGYDCNDNSTDFNIDFGDYSTEEEARKRFKYVVNSHNLFYNDEPAVSYWKIQLEECEKTGHNIECIDVLEEENLYIDILTH